MTSQEAINRPAYSFPMLAFGMTIGERIRARLTELGISESELARRSRVSQPVINALVNGTQRSSKFLPEIAAALNVAPSDLDPRLLEGQYSPAPRFLGERDLPVYAAAEGGPGQLVVSTDPIELVPRPWYLGEVRDGYAVVVSGESMSPAFEPGDMAIVNPRLPPMKNRHHIIVSNDDNGEFRATIKKLTGWNNDEWLLEQYNPPVGQEKVFRLNRRQWPKALRVVGKYEG